MGGGWVPGAFSACDNLLLRCRRWQGNLSSQRALHDTCLCSARPSRSRSAAGSPRWRPLRARASCSNITGWRIPRGILRMSGGKSTSTPARRLRLDPGTTKNNRRARLADALASTTRALQGTTRRAGPAAPGTWVALPRGFLSQRGPDYRLLERRGRLPAGERGCPGRKPHDLRRTAVRNLLCEPVCLDRVAMQMTWTQNSVRVREVQHR